MSGFQPISVKVDGQTYNGAWELAVGMVNVSSAYGSISAPADQKPAATAERLLAEMVQQATAGLIAGSLGRDQP